MGILDFLKRDKGGASTGSADVAGQAPTAQAPSETPAAQEPTTSPVGTASSPTPTVPEPPSGTTEK